MKIIPEHFDHMKTEINKYAESVGGWEVLVKKYESGEFHFPELCKNLQKRFCWEIHDKAGLLAFTCDVVYNYANDEHIYTALRKICPIVTRKY